MEVSISNYVNNLISIRNEKQQRWFYSQGKFSSINKSKIPCTAIKKFEKILSRFHADLKQYEPSEVDKNTVENLKTLRTIVERKVENYKKAHGSVWGKVYLFFCRIFYGNINEINKKLLANIDRLCGENNASDQPSDKEKIPQDTSNKPASDSKGSTSKGGDSNQDLDAGSGNRIKKPLNPNPAKLPETGSGKKGPLDPNATKTDPASDTKEEEEVTDPLFAAPKYGAYVSPEADPTKELVNKVKQGRFKLINFLSEIVLLPAFGRVCLPLLQITDKGVSIYIQQDYDLSKVDESELKDDKLAAFKKQKELEAGVKDSSEKVVKYPKAQDLENWLEGKFNNVDPKIDFKKDTLGSEVEIKHPKTQKVISKRYRPGNYADMMVVKKFTISLNDALRLINTVTDEGLSNLSTLTKNSDLKIQVCRTSELYGNEVSLENTISLTLSQLNYELGLQLMVEDYTSHPLPHAKVEIPIVEFDDQGMIIKIPEKQEELKDMIQQIFGFEGEGIDDTCYGRKYSYQFKVDRSEIENFLKLLGLDLIPSNDLYKKRYGNGDITYLQHLIQTKRYYPYRAVRTDDVLESIEKSIVALIPNEAQTKPYVSYHPRGWLSIKLPFGTEEYNKKLAKYLKCDLIPINQHFNNEDYANEIIVYDEEVIINDKKVSDLSIFLKKLDLENTPAQTSYLESLKEHAGKESLEVFYVEKGDKSLDLPNTIARTLSALDPDTKSTLKANDATKIAALSLVEVKYDLYGLHIKIPKALNDKKIKIGPAKELTFVEYFSHVFGREEERHDLQFSYFKIPLQEVKGFLEKDLSMRKLPDPYHHNEVTTAFGYMQFDLSKKFTGYEIQPSGAIKDFTLRNPAIPLPKDEDLPSMSDEDIIRNVRDFFRDHSKKEKYVATFQNILDNVNNAHAASEHTRKGIRTYLLLIINELNTNKKTPLKTKIDALADIGETCGPGICMPGRLVKIQNVYQNLKSPEFADIVKSILLDKIEKYKNDVLNTIFQEDGDTQTAHTLSGAQVDWGDEFGLNKEAGLMDEYLGIGKGHLYGNRSSSTYKNKFKETCNKGMLEAIHIAVNLDMDEEKDLLINYDDFQTRFRIILKKEGLKPSQIDNEIEKLMENNKIVTKDGIKMLLADIGVLYS